MAFKFEDYTTPEAAQETLNASFPQGADNNDLVELMQQAGAECEVGDVHTSCFYFQTEPSSTVNSEWLVHSEAEDSKINKITVHYFNHRQSRPKPDTIKGFRFEDFEAAGPAEAKLTQLFPTGTNIEELTNFMKKLNAKCKGPFQDVENNRIVTCKYHVKTSLMAGIDWSVYARLDGSEKIAKLETYRHISSI